MNKDLLPENSLPTERHDLPVVLTIDTSAPQAGLAITRGKDVLAALADHSGRPHSQTLFINLEQLLRAAALTINDIDAFAAITGPGSFTGLRVGMAATQGLAHTLNRPAIGITTIDACALAAEVNGKVLVMMDALRGEVFCGLREVQPDADRLSVRMLGSDLSAAPAAALSAVLPLIADDPVVVVGSGVARYQELLYRQREKSAALWQINQGAPFLASVAGRYAGCLLRAGQLPAVQAYYIRLSDAEIKFPQAHG